MESQNLKSRFLNEHDYPTLCKWWKDNRFPIIPKELLPNNGLDGLMVFDEITNTKICAGFIYKTSSPYLGWIEWIVADFYIKDRPLREQAKQVLMQDLIGVGRQIGLKKIFTSVKHKGLINCFENNGFVKTSTQATEMVLSL